MTIETTIVLGCIASRRRLLGSLTEQSPVDNPTRSSPPQACTEVDLAAPVHGYTPDGVVQ
ncbi:hypothetical protein [Rhodococcus sp. OK302]|uniref:hypothetical protein n=1 Tax=Rhodococcus sp. OK302 TaxID=1882769 RepID=UPI000B9414AD|nr:hypothetical protein [Rhodococcus sp. OK302]